MRIAIGGRAPASRQRIRKLAAVANPLRGRASSYRRCRCSPSCRRGFATSSSAARHCRAVRRDCGRTRRCGEATAIVRMSGRRDRAARASHAHLLATQQEPDREQQEHRSQRRFRSNGRAGGPKAEEGRHDRDRALRRSRATRRRIAAARTTGRTPDTAPAANKTNAG